ncbi:ATP-binding protein [Sulfuritalea sp.]|uniref:hybrid sensor histidine kinase/response regulator n=1 Tax=Sulfuritalea sp. TaxID=2480090 RepID=UPI001AC06232|nr:ATP-binding protein [Sulfuritalea sp.]MBN8474031.1 response regulator [Sulfuritalea sp.]
MSMQRSLRARLLVSALLPVTLVAVLLTILFMSRAIDDLEQGLQTRGKAIARQMASAAEFGIFAGQRAGLSILTESALRIDPDVRGAAIVQETGAIMARSGELNLAGWPALGRIEGHRVESGVLLFIEPVMRSSVPVDDIYGGGAQILPAAAVAVVGHVVVEMSLRAVAVRTERLIAIGILIALLGSVLGGWLARIIARGVTGPLLEANEVVERIGAGDMTARMGSRSAGALGKLAAGINDMAERVGLNQDDLRARIAEATAGLQREKEAAEHATIAKSHFLAAASHDLRQPLHALGLFVSALAQSDAARREPELVSSIQSGVNTLQNLLDAILDISRLDGGNLVPEIERFPLGPVLERAVGDVALLAKDKGLRLRVRPTRAWVRSDRKIVERILLNLIGNALRYTRSGGVLVSCRQRKDAVLIEVWDTGMGIPDHAREEIFEEYVQLDNIERDSAKGLGLGLAICRRLAELLGVPLGVRSRPGRGSVFWIQLPVVPPAGADESGGIDAARGELLDSSVHLSGTVLVVDGDPLVRAGMQMAIAGWGIRVMLAANREEALGCCRGAEPAPDVAICNLRLPGRVSGIAVAQELQREFGGCGVLLIGTELSEEVLAEARAAGFSLLRQPLPPGRLRAALQQMLPIAA